jgi:hypothetical protein
VAERSRVGGVAQRDDVAEQGGEGPGMSTPTVTAIATAAMNAMETFTGLGVVTKMIADIICGPAIIVIARGRISRFMTLALG